MTAPVSHGFPDWGRYQARAGKLFDLQLIFGQVGARTFGPYFVGDVRHLGLSLVVGTSGASIDLEYYADATLTFLMGQDHVTLLAGGVFERTVPALGPYFIIRFTPNASPFDIAMRIWQADDPSTPFALTAIDNILVSQVAVPHAPGVTSLDIVNARAGPANMYVRLPAVQSEVRLSSCSPAGVLTFLTSVVTPDVSGDRRIYLPNTGLRVEWINTTAVNQDFSVVVTVQMGFPTG